MDGKDLWVNETWCNRTEGYLIGDSEPYETRYADVGALFRSLQCRYGRCIGKMYADRKDGSTIQTGWVFEQRTKYTDVRKYYIRETWVTVWRDPPAKIPEHWTGGSYAF